jgi:hypothetical protein
MTRAAPARGQRQGLLAAVFLAGMGTDVFAQDEGPAVVPYRPSVATPAALPAPGWPELEAGWNGAKGGDTARSQSLPMLFKLAWNDSWAVLIGTDAYAWQRDDDGATARSGGDTTLTLKYKLPVNDTLALGVEFGASLPTARPPIGTGRTGWGCNGIASLDLDETHIDINTSAARLGAMDAGQGQWQGGWAVAVSHPLAGEFGVTGELSGTVQHGTTAQSQGLVALNYNVSRTLVLDVAAAAGLSRAAPNLQLMAGLTVQLGHWF